MLFCFKHFVFKFLLFPKCSQILNLNSFSMPVQRVSYWDFQTVFSASVQSIFCYSAVKFRIGKLYTNLYTNLNISMLYRLAICSFISAFFIYPNIILIILKILSFIFIISYDLKFEISTIFCIYALKSLRRYEGALCQS